VEKMVEVEKFTQFKKCFGIEVNLWDMFLDDHHPDIFYLSAKRKQHTVFLRKAYDRGRLVEPNDVSEARSKLVELMLLRRCGLGMPISGTADSSDTGDFTESMRAACWRYRRHQRNENVVRWFFMFFSLLSCVLLFD
jgi:hypothetical protein